MRADRGERRETKGRRGRGPGGGLRAAGKGAHRRGGRGGSAVLRATAGPRNSAPRPAPAPALVSVPEPILGAQEEAGRQPGGPGTRGRRARGCVGPARRSGRAAVAPAGPRAPAGSVSGCPADPVSLPSTPGTWPEASERRQAAAADDEVEREGAHAPAQASQPRRQLLHGMGAPGPPSRGPDGQSRAVRAPAPAAASWGRRGAPRLAARPGCGRHVAGLPAGRRPPPPAPRPTPRPRPAAAAKSRPPPGPRGPPPSPDVQVTAGMEAPGRGPGGETETRSGV